MKTPIRTCGWKQIDTGKRVGSRKIMATCSKRVLLFTGAALIDRNCGIEPGTLVRIAKLHGCPPPGTMGHYHVADADTGALLGLVAYGSLDPAGRAG